MNDKLTAKQLAFVEAYCNPTSETQRNGTASYLKAYGCSVKAAEVGASKLLRVPKIMKAVSHMEVKIEEVAERLEIDAEWVLRQGVELLEMAKGATPMINEHMQEIRTKDPDGNDVVEYRKVTHELCQTNLAVANQILNTIGKNRAVQAFLEQVEVSHTHKLEELLNTRRKRLEAVA